MSEATQNGLTVGFIIMIFTDLIGNTLVILTVFKTPAMRTPMNYLLVNLAVADITVAIFIAPRYLLETTIFDSFCLHFWYLVPYLESTSKFGHYISIISIYGN